MKILDSIQKVVMAILTMATYLIPFTLLYETALADGINSFFVVLSVVIIAVWTLLYINIVRNLIEWIKRDT